MKHIVVNPSLTKMVLIEEKVRSLGNCKIVKRESENIVDKVGSGSMKREVPKQRQTIERECDWITVDKEEAQRQRALVAQRREKMKRIESQPREDGDNGFVSIRKDVLDSILDRISPEGERDVDISETELSPSELRGKRAEKAKLAKVKDRERISQNRRERYLNSVTESGDKKISKPLRLVIRSDDEIEEARKKKKKNCSDFPSGTRQGANPFHDPTTGRLTSREEAGSWSLRNATGSACKRGQAKMKGGRELFTKIACGRGEKYRCRDGSEKW